MDKTFWLRRSRAKVRPLFGIISFRHHISSGACGLQYCEMAELVRHRVMRALLFLWLGHKVGIKTVMTSSTITSVPGAPAPDTDTSASPKNIVHPWINLSNRRRHRIKVRAKLTPGSGSMPRSRQLIGLCLEELRTPDIQRRQFLV